MRPGFHHPSKVGNSLAFLVYPIECEWVPVDWKPRPCSPIERGAVMPFFNDLIRSGPGSVPMTTVTGHGPTGGPQPVSDATTPGSDTTDAVSDPGEPGSQRAARAASDLELVLSSGELPADSRVGDLGPDVLGQDGSHGKRAVLHAVGWNERWCRQSRWTGDAARCSRVDALGGNRFPNAGELCSWYRHGLRRRYRNSLHGTGIPCPPSQGSRCADRPDAASWEGGGQG